MSSIKEKKKIIKIEYDKLYKQKCKELKKNKENLKEIIKELKEIKNELKEKQKELLILHKLRKGCLCSVSGLTYEKKIYNIVKYCNLNNKQFNTQNENELGGSRSLNDIQCNYINYNDIGIEIKKCNTPDWMQCTIKYNNINNNWEASTKGKNPKESRILFNQLINNIQIFGGNVPPFITDKITHEEWILIKKNTDMWNDCYIPIPNDTINKMYSSKGCQYIQISEYGLYYLGNDICNFNVPPFIVDQQLRIRTKVHKKKNKKGFCILSVTIACQPININVLLKSQYSLDDKNRLPKNLIYNFNQ